MPAITRPCWSMWSLNGFGGQCSWSGGGGDSSEWGTIPYSEQRGLVVFDISTDQFIQRKQCACTMLKDLFNWTCGNCFNVRGENNLSGMCMW